MQSVW
ncbi:unnamed protein product [Larinioides sclopetarius]